MVVFLRNRDDEELCSSWGSPDSMFGDHQRKKLIFFLWVHQIILNDV